MIFVGSKWSAKEERQPDSRDHTALQVAVKLRKKDMESTFSRYSLAPPKLLLCSFQAIVIAFINLQQVFGKGPLRISSSAETHRELTVPLNPSAHTRSCFRDTPANPLARLSMTTAHLQCPKW